MKQIQQLKQIQQFISKNRPIILSTLFVIVILSFWYYKISPLEPIPSSLGLIQEFTALKYELYRDLLMAVLAIIGTASVGIFLLIRQGIDSQIDKRTKRLESLLKVRIGLSRIKDIGKQYDLETNTILMSGTNSNSMPFWLKEQIDFAKKVVEETKNLDQELDKDLILLTKNNLAYSLLISKTEEIVARKLAREIYEEVQTQPTNYHHLHTYAWVLLRYAKNLEEKQNASRVFLDELYTQRNQIHDAEFLDKIEKHKKIFETTSPN